MMRQETFLWQYNIQNYSFYDSEQWTRKKNLVFLDLKIMLLFYLDVWSTNT